VAQKLGFGNAKAQFLSHVWYIIYRGNCKTPFGIKFVLLALDSDFSQIAYGHCEKPNQRQNHQI
jgi:hypothetical protein